MSRTSGAVPGALPWLEVEGIALASALLGQIFLDGASYVVAAVSFALALGVSALRRARATRFDDEGRRLAERRMGSLMIGASFLVPLGLARTPDALRALGVVSPLARHRLDEAGAAVVVAAAVALLLPLVLGEVALRAGPSAGPIDARRLRVALRAGAMVALVAIGGSAATVAVATLHLEIDATRGGAGPSAATRRLLARLPAPARVSLVFRDQDETFDDARAYFEAIAGERLRVVDLDPARDAAIQGELGREDDGIVVLASGEATEQVLVGRSRDAPQGPHLPALDGDVQRALSRLAGPGRIAYLTTGHGEASATAVSAERRITRLRALLESQGLTPRELDLGRGLGDDIPSDAAMVLVLGPTGTAGRFAKEEDDVLRRYRDRGGRILLAIDPADSNLELHALFGLHVRGAPITLTRPVARRRNDATDAGIVVVTGDSARGGRFASHPSVATLARQAGRTQLYVPGARALDVEPGSHPSVVFAIETTKDAFLDGDADFERSEIEPMGPFVIGAAVEDDPDGAPRPWRAFVLGGVGALTDDAMSSSASNPALCLDVISWLRGEEDITAVEAPATPDRIVHTRKEDALWFWGAILGVPASIAALGVFARRRLRRA